MEKKFPKAPYLLDTLILIGGGILERTSIYNLRAFKLGRKTQIMFD